MLKWCSYCQKFQGETAPYDVLSFSHGLCEVCRPGALSLTERDLAHARTLQSIQMQLREVGRRGDLSAAQEIVCAAENAGVRPVDALIGLVAPLLHEVGDGWQCATISVADEHRFSAFCEGLYELLASRTAARAAAPVPLQRTEILLMNALGNRHTLGVRLLALWLRGQGLRARFVAETRGLDSVAACVELIQPRVLMISMALAEQLESVAAVVARVGLLPTHLRPRVLVGGYAVKLELVAPIPGAEFVADLLSSPLRLTAPPDPAATNESLHRKPA